MEKSSQQYLKNAIRYVWVYERKDEPCWALNKSLVNETETLFGERIRLLGERI